MVIRCSLFKLSSINRIEYREDTRSHEKRWLTIYTGDKTANIKISQSSKDLLNSLFEGSHIPIAE